MAASTSFVQIDAVKNDAGILGGPQRPLLLIGRVVDVVETALRQVELLVDPGVEGLDSVGSVGPRRGDGIEQRINLRFGGTKGGLGQEAGHIATDLVVVGQILEGWRCRWRR